MTPFTLKNRLGIEGTEAWIVSADKFTDLLGLVYTNHRGEIWLFNNDLKIFEDADLFRQIYLQKIGGDLGSHIRSVKILLNDAVKDYVFPKPKDWMRVRLAAWHKQKQQNKTMPELMFGRVSEAFMLPEINGILNQRNIPPTDAWIFYLHGASLCRTRQNGLALLRQTQFPFAPRDEPLALSWQLSENHILSAEHKTAFTKSFLYPSLFWRLDQDLNLRKAPTRLVESDMESQRDEPEGIAFGEEADVLVLAPAADELQCLRPFLQKGIRRIPCPVTTQIEYECWTKHGDKHVVLATIGEGNLSAAVITTQLLEKFRPKRVILFGVAGAIPLGRNKPEIGDVVIGQTAIWYEWGVVSQQDSEPWKFTPKRDIPTAWGGETANRQLYQMASKLVGKSLKVGTRKTYRPAKISRPPKVALGIVGSGSKIVSSHRFIQDVIHNVDPKINTFETEAAGVCQACASFPEHHVDCLVVRGIMDMADNRTRDDKVRKQNRDYARRSCALFVAILLDKL